MATDQPLKTLILYNNPVEIHAIKSFTKKFPGLFGEQRISGEIFDTYHILSAEHFGLTFFDETLFSTDLVERIGKRRFGIIAFKNKKTLSWKLNLATKAEGYFSFNPLTDNGNADLLKAVKAEVFNRNSAQHLPSGHRKPKFQFRNDHGTVSLGEEDIIYMKVRDKMSEAFYEENGEIKRAYRWIPIGEYEKRLDSSIFFRTHKQYLVNLSFLKNIVESDKVITLTKRQHGKQITIAISNQRLRELKKILKQDWVR